MITKRILVVEVNWLGDVLFSTAAIRALKNKYPGSYIGVLLHKRCRDVLADNPYINEIIVLDEEGEHRGIFGKLKLIRQLKSGQFDIAYLFHRSFTRTLICLLSGIKSRVGYYTAKRRLLLTDSVKVPRRVHRAAYYYYLVTRNIPTDARMLHSDFIIRDKDVVYIDSLLKQAGFDSGNKLVVIHTAGNWSLKRWPKENFVELADELINRFQAKVIFSGAKEERALMEEILKSMKNKAVNLAGQTTIKQLGALFIRANTIISADSGPLHIAVALNRPIVALFGPTSKEITGPLIRDNVVLLQKKVDCAIPCYKQNCPDNICMKKISPIEVIRAIQENKWLTADKTAK
ncbi:MAG: lipopolysaccharide heptosyltransferase II [Candidatus Omnitrophica bacterium]|nr:lipopolysaccharide heptosyltransferase II [Candidatus Omnitrophota bacterium]MDD5355815.1 lipopolysaccharide heptosyltransferase II [Candidatus Omnitrophota bacterium]